MHFTNVLFCHSEVNQLSMTIIVNDNIIWFEISINNVSGMQVSECKQDLSNIKFGLF